MKEVDLLQRKEAREDCISRVEVLDKVGELLLLPNTEYATTKQVAEYYGVGVRAITSLVFDNKDEVVSDGYKVMKGKELENTNTIPFKEFTKNRANYKFTMEDGSILSVGGGGVGLFPKRAILRIGMLLTESEVAKEVRKLLLKENPKLFSELSPENNLRFKKYETEIKNFLNFTFGEENVKCQVRCGKYNLDFVLFDIVHIEVDEFGHISYDKEKEKERQEYILKYTDYYTFRYNPQKDKPYKLIYEIMDLFTHIGFPNDVEEDDCYYKNYYFES